MPDTARLRSASAPRHSLGSPAPKRDNVWHPPCVQSTHGGCLCQLDGEWVRPHARAGIRSLNFNRGIRAAVSVSCSKPSGSPEVSRNPGWGTHRGWVTSGIPGSPNRAWNPRPPGEAGSRFNRLSGVEDCTFSQHPIAPVALGLTPPCEQGQLFGRRPMEPTGPPSKRTGPTQLPVLRTRSTEDVQLQGYQSSKCNVTLRPTVR